MSKAEIVNAAMDVLRADVKNVHEEGTFLSIRTHVLRRVISDVYDAARLEAVPRNPGTKGGNDA